jgi:hypothetical protein
MYRAVKRLDEPDDALEERRLAGAVRATDSDERTWPEHTREVVNRRVPIIAERHILEAERGGSHDRTPRIIAQMRKPTLPAVSRRTANPRRRRLGARAGGAAGRIERAWL